MHDILRVEVRVVHDLASARLNGLERQRDLVRARVTRVLIEGGRAVGVEARLLDEHAARGRAREECPGLAGIRPRVDEQLAGDGARETLQPAFRDGDRAARLFLRGISMWLLLIVPTVLLILGSYHGLMQVLYRAGMIRGSQFLGLTYFQGLTLHGVVNAIVFTTFFAVAFGYAVIRYYLRRPLNMKVAWLSFGLMILGTLLASAAILSGKATVLYTFYPPLRAHPAFYVGVVLLVIGSWIAFFNWLPPYFSWKREHRGEKVPLAVVGIFATFIIWLIATTPVAIEVIFLLIPWSMGWVPTVNVPLARMLFWFFGHPLVYFWLVPAYVMYYTMLPKLAGGKLFSDFAGRLTFLWLVLYSAPVGIHHQFTEPGISSTWKFVHAFFTMLIRPSIWARRRCNCLNFQEWLRSCNCRGSRGQSPL